MRKQCISAALCTLLLFGACGCGKEKEAGKVNVWSYTSAQRILRDKEYEEASKYPGRIDIFACRNEEESAQLILTPENSVNSYNLTVSDLKNASGDILEADCFSVFNQKYRNVTVASDGYSAGLGWYPDALLPPFSF